MFLQQQRYIFQRSFYLRRGFCTAAPQLNEQISQQLSISFNPDLKVLDRVDSLFQTQRSISKELVAGKDHINNIKGIFMQLVQMMVGNSTFNHNKCQIERRLSMILQENLNVLSQNSLKVGLLNTSVLGKSENEIFNRIDVSQLGYLKVFNIDMVRENNLFIHQYKIEKNKDRLSYSPKPDPELSRIPKTKKEKKQEEMMETLTPEKVDRPVRDAVFWAAKKIGFITPEDYSKPGIIGRILDPQTSLYSRVEGEDYILVEDYEILSPFGFYIKDIKTGEILKSEGKDGDSFRHFLRLERRFEAKDAPSVRKEKQILLTDLDFLLRGNPHSLVKNFTSISN